MRLFALGIEVLKDDFGAIQIIQMEIVCMPRGLDVFCIDLARLGRAQDAIPFADLGFDRRGLPDLKLPCFGAIGFQLQLSGLDRSSGHG